MNLMAPRPSCQFCPSVPTPHLPFVEFGLSPLAVTQPSLDTPEWGCIIPQGSLSQLGSVCLERI